MFFAPLVLVAQSDFDAGELEPDVVSENLIDNSTQSSGTKDINDDSVLAEYATEIPSASDLPSDANASDSQVPEIPSVSEQILAGEAEVVLDLPEQDDSGTSSMTSKETISVDFPDEDVRTVLRSVADLFDLNLVIPDSLQGRTSIKLRNITWDQVFEVVLDPLGYTFVEDRNIVRIKSIQELTTEPVDTRIFIANYARAEELKESIAPLVDSAAGGNIQVDTRSNALVIKERPSRMSKIQEVIDSLDQPTEQVMIESKFIEVSDRDIENIGINWASLNGYDVSAGPFGRSITDEQTSRYQRTSIPGNPVPTNIDEINTARAADVADNGVEDGSVFVPGPILPAEFTKTIDNLKTTIDTAVFSAGEFEVILSALETKNDIKLVSNPTVVTLNNTSAKIAIGERYPLPQYAFNAQTGERQLTGIEYIDIGINLDVIPSVNDAGSINLDVVPEVSAIGEIVNIEGTEIPRIRSRRTEANITIKDGYTLAIGGLSEEDTNNNSTKVPLLGDLPGIGQFFRSKSNDTISRNLVIFITAKTLDPDGSTYDEVIDPRVLNEMQIVPSDLPGYDLSEEDLEILEKMKELRIESRHENEIEAIQNEIELIEKAKREKELKEEKKSKKKKKK